MLKTLDKWAADAIAVQDACNLSGIVFAFERMTNDLREAGELRPDHPCIVLWADKMDDLARSRHLAAASVNNFDLAIASLTAAMRRVCDIEPRLGTDERNIHPDVQEAIAVIATMTGSRDIMAYGEAYDAVMDMKAA